MCIQKQKTQTHSSPEILENCCAFTLWSHWNTPMSKNTNGSYIFLSYAIKRC